ncbi:MAG: hypothetical protein WC509_08510 [Candidatus Izemoplasmatales bacterium]
MAILKMFVRGFLLLLSSAFLFAGMMILTDTFGFDILPLLQHAAGSGAWWLGLFLALLFLAAGVGSGFLLRHLTKRWDDTVA